MSMSDCYCCWDTPCTCGYEYRYWSDKRLEEFITTLRLVQAIRKEKPELLRWRDPCKPDKGWIKEMHKRQLRGQ